ncbi:MAG: hypothetical protein IKE94_10065 [Aeriscardovia sp.]|nr:hypothetical protein [Aeriscardovia sp.]
MAKYPDLKSYYLQANYIELFTSEIQKFVDGNFDGGGFHSINVLSLLKHKIENVEVKALTGHNGARTHHKDGWRLICGYCGAWARYEGVRV